MERTDHFYRSQINRMPHDKPFNKFHVAKAQRRAQA